MAAKRNTDRPGKSKEPPMTRAEALLITQQIKNQYEHLHKLIIRAERLKVGRK